MHKQRFFPDELKCAKVVSKITTSLSKLHESYIHQQMNKYFIFIKVPMRFQTRIQCTTQLFSDGRKNERN